MNGVMEFHNEALGVQIRTILNEDGSISMNAEDTQFPRKIRKDTYTEKIK